MGSIIKLLLALPGLISGLLDLIKKIGEMLKERAQKKRSDKVDEAVEEYKKPKKTQEEVSNAACKVEKVLNPNSDCDKP